ncbi:DNA glycosylase [Lizonia empirigonia]|nr:DNA glycosylase [Lizonia empirigonia]
MALRAAEWYKLPTSLTELCLNTTLRCGQSFRWRKSDDDVWSCAMHGRILSLRQDTEAIHYRAIFPSKPTLPTPPTSAAPSVAADDDDTLAFINHYFNLTPNLGQLYEQWAASDSNFKRRAPKFAGIRILRQDAWEALIGFICSSNNNISRISGMVHNLCLHYGPLIGHIDDVPYHDFPTPQSLCKPDVEEHLRNLGFGYRAKYIAKTARIVAEEKGGLAWLEALSNPEYPQFGIEPRPTGELLEGGREGYRKAHEELLVLQGVGPKVADCVCLFGLGWLESVPVDTHVWQIAQRDYKFGKGKHSSLTAATYVAIGNLFRELWGKEAGWAHSVLFTADLKAFSERTVAKTEIKEEEVKIKKEIVTEVVVKQETTKRKRIKKEPNENEHQVIEVKEVTRRSKRQRA